MCRSPSFFADLVRHFVTWNGEDHGQCEALQPGWGQGTVVQSLPSLNWRNPTIKKLGEEKKHFEKDKYEARLR